MKENYHDCGWFRNKWTLYWTVDVASKAGMTLMLVASWWQHCTLKEASSHAGRPQASIRCHITSPSPRLCPQTRQNMMTNTPWWSSDRAKIPLPLSTLCASLFLPAYIFYDSRSSTMFQAHSFNSMALESFTALGWTLTHGPKATIKWPTHAITLNQKQWNKYPYHGMCNKPEWGDTVLKQDLDHIIFLSQDQASEHHKVITLKYLLPLTFIS